MSHFLWSFMDFDFSTLLPVPCQSLAVTDKCSPKSKTHLTQAAPKKFVKFALGLLWNNFGPKYLGAA